MIKKITEKTINDVRLLVPLEGYRKLMAYAGACDSEVTGFADVEFDEEKCAFVMSKIYLLEQTASAAEVEMDEETLANFNLQLMQQDVTQLPRLWWHSHNNFEVFFSATDEGTIENLKNSSFIVAVVVNKNKEIYAKARVYEPISFVIEPLKVEILFSDSEIPEEIKEEVKEKVKKRVWVAPKPSILNKLPFFKKDGIGAMKSLGKDMDKNIQLVQSRGLVPEYSQIVNCWVYVDPQTEDRWYDIDHTLDEIDLYDIYQDPEWVKEHHD